MKQDQLKIFLDGASTRIKNKRITFKEGEESTIINFRFADSDANNPACSHVCHKGKVRETSICLSNDAMMRLVYSWIEFKKNKKK